MLGLLGYRLRSPGPDFDVAVWFSEAAADHADLEDRVVGLLEPALAEPAPGATVGVRSRPVPLEEEQGRRLVTETWPRLVVAGFLGRGPVRPVGAVNVLVTDGDPSSDPAGYGMWRVAAVTGARYLARLPPTIRETAVSDYSTSAAVAQLLLHECGHALGLAHDHGEVTVEGDAVTASPMVGSYAWADEDVARRQVGSGQNACGDALSSGNERQRRLALRYSDCARRAVHGGTSLVPE